MSIYATLWEIQVRTDDDRWVEVFAQGVPGHVGHPAYGADAFADFLPPPVAVEDPGDAEDVLRAVVIIAADRCEKEGQRYIAPLLVLTGEGYAVARFDDLLQRIQEALAEGSGE